MDTQLEGLRSRHLIIVMMNIWTKMDENWEWKTLHDEEVHSLHRSPYVVGVITSRRLGWTGHEDMHSTFYRLKLKERNREKGLGVDGRVVLDLK